jgi:PTS system mannose-specific IIA component
MVDTIATELTGAESPRHRQISGRIAKIPSCAGALDGQSGAFVRCTKSTREEFSMIGLVLVTHGRLADEFKAALEHVMGPQKQIEAVTIGAEDDSDLCRSDIIEAVNRVDTGDGVAILTDMFGGTPSNLAISCMSRPKVEVLAGINLPMLVKLAKVREERSLPDAIAMAQEAGRKYVTIASRVLAGK